MPIKDISNDVLTKDIKPAVVLALANADRNGIGRDKLEKVIKNVIGITPDRDQFHQIMWVCGHETGTNGLFYSVGKVPDKFRKEKKVKPAPAPVSNKTSHVVEESYDEIGGPIKDVRIRGSLTTTATSSAKKKIAKVRIYYATVLVFFVSAGLAAHLLGFI